ncbi:MAG TPA: DsbA family protein, partial [Paracoccus sp. (in: a-proteobacteria)]|nr:DsbA family protein [Paracoccus sp. (in: a-proteobacteria)]
MAHIDYYFGTPSPWVYLAGGRLQEIATRHGATITYKPLDLMQLFDRTGGTRPDQRHPSRNEYRAQELGRWSQHLDMPLNLRPAFWPVNPAPSSYAIIAAQEAGGGDLPASAGGRAQLGADDEHEQHHTQGGKRGQRGARRGREQLRMQL